MVNKNNTLFLVITLLATTMAVAQPIQKDSSKTTGKQLYIPDTVWNVPDKNNYSDNNSEFSFQRMRETENIVAFWSKEFGDSPMNNPDSTKRFDITYALQECERFYDAYVNQLKFTDKGNSLTDKYKILLYIVAGDDGTAYGGGEGNKVGILWTPPARMSKPPYGALAHELGHSFQYLNNADGHWGFTSAPEGSHGQTIFEMTSQYMLWQVYPEWMTFENYHLVAFMKQTHYAFLHEINQYHSPYVLEYWSGKHGLDFIGKLWKNAKEGEDPVITYKRLTSITQKEFNDEIFDAARRFVTWDMQRIKDVASTYANQHVTKLDVLKDGWFQIAQSHCPQNYGYNAIKLQVPSKRKVTLHFEGLDKAEGFRSIQPDKAGWRYGFLAVKENGERVYGETYSDRKGKVTFNVPPDSKYLWLVVSGAPTEHWQHLTDGKDENDEQWPYKIKLSGTSPAQDTLKK